jgi:glycosyltransferase involved in cell wall biosynthesis
VSPEVPAFGGAGIASYLEEATRALSAAGHECHVLTWGERHAPELKAEPGHVLHVRNSATAALDAFAGVDADLRVSKLVAGWVLELQREHRFDIIEGTDWCAPLYALLQCRNVEPLLRDVLVSVFNHGTTYNIARHQRTFTPRHVYQRVNLEHQCIRLADIVVCPSHAARESIIAVHDADPRRIKIIPEPLTWKTAPAPVALPETALYFGSVSASKGLHEFTYVTNQLLQKHPHLRVEFIGPLHAMGRSIDDFTTDIVRSLRTSPEKITFRGPLPRSAAIQAVGQRHIAVNMSQRETYCYSFAECIMRGALPIALRNSAQAEFIPEMLREKYTVGTMLSEISDLAADILSVEGLGERPAIVDYAKAKTAPQAYATAYEQLAGSSARSVRIEVGAAFTGADVTVLIPAHNPDPYLLETIASIHAQRVEPHRIIVGNDGSNERRALDLLSQAATLPGVSVVDFDWRGLAETRNRLLKVCTTKLFAFVDADDLLMPDFIDVSLQFLNANFELGVRSVQGWYELFGAQTGVRGPVVFQHFTHSLWNDLKNNHLGVADVFRELRYNSGLVGGEAEDWELWLRYFQSGWETRVIPRVLWRYRRHERALSSRWSEAMSVGTARANARVMRAHLTDHQASHVWDFIGEYMYLGETFFNSYSKATDDAPRPPSIHNKSIGKLERRLMNFQLRGAEPTMRQRAALRLMRSLSRSLK